jgi:Fe-S oxidoreductase
MPRPLIFGFILTIAFVLFIYSCIRKFSILQIGQKDHRFDHITYRIITVVRVALGQSKLLRDPLAGLMHFFIFWGFIILLSAVVEALIQGYSRKFSLQWLGSLFLPLAVLQESIGLLVVISCLLALIRWHLFSPKRFFGREVTGHVRMDATLILALILIIMASMFGTNASGIAETAPIYGRFVSNLLANLFPAHQAHRWHELLWWTHIVVILGFLNYLPYSKHLHILTSIPNVFFSSIRPKGELVKLDFEEEAEKFGAEDIQDLTWKQIFDGFTCTDCGRCTAACPASITGKLLSPRKIIMDIRERSTELSHSVEKEISPSGRLLDGYISEEELWACTTCRACMEECPVMIEHIPAIIQMRRYLVLTESRFPKELTTAFKGLETSANPWGLNSDAREDWTRGLTVNTMAQTGGNVDYLYWVGCAGAFDARYQKVSRAVVKLLNAARINFAILGKEEKCNGDHARRCGNEYLGQMLIADNIETLSRYNVKNIIAACPHCYNALKNDYPQFGGRYNVLHHSEFLLHLIRIGALKISKHNLKRVAFHDSCYIGRYHEIYSEPRELIALSGSKSLAVKRSRSHGLCCGAGGARMFMEEKTGKRINVERTEELLSSSPDTIATECPFCMMMLTDGLKAKNADERVQVLDIAEILAEQI